MDYIDVHLLGFFSCLVLLYVLLWLELKKKIREYSLCVVPWSAGSTFSRTDKLGSFDSLSVWKRNKHHIIENPNFYTTFRVALLDLLAASDTKCLDLDLVVRTCLVFKKVFYSIRCKHLGPVGMFR